MRVVLPCKFSVTIHKEVRTVDVDRHPLHDLFEFGVTGNQVLSLCLRLFYQLLRGESPPDKKCVLVFHVINLVKCHGFRGSSHVIF